MWPRHYADAIRKEPSRVKRNQMLNQVPQDWRGLVEKHVKLELEKRHAKPKQYL